MNICKKCGKQFTQQKGLINYCSLSCRNSRTWTEKDKLKKSIAAKNSAKVKKTLQHPRFNLRGPDHPNWVQKIETKCLYCGKPITHNITKIRKYHGQCWLKCSGGYRKNSTIKHRSIYKGYQMDSGAELAFAKLLDKHNIIWIKNTEQYFHYFDIENKKRKYYPDFYLPKYKYWVEIKGKFYQNENDKFKLQAIKNIELILSDNIRLPKIIKNKNINFLYL